MGVQLEQGDIFLTRGNGFLSRAIRFFTRSIGEARTKAEHTGIVVTNGPITSVFIVEALSRVRRHKLWKRYSPFSKVAIAIYRPKNLTKNEKFAVVAKAESYIGRKYGYLKIVAHVLDWIFFGVYFFRRIAKMDAYPICSWVVAYSFAAVGKHFGVAPGAASPDDIYDFIDIHPEIYETIHLLQPVAI